MGCYGAHRGAMNRRFLLLFLCVFWTACGGARVPMAPVESPHFGAVSKELRLGGTVYTYVDIDGDAERAADFVLSLLRDLPELFSEHGTSRLSATAVARILGLHDVKAVGLSSYEDGELYQNRSFIHHAGVRQGLLRLFGGDPTELGILQIAPPEADFVWEQQLDVGALVDIVRALGSLGLGMSPEELDDALREPVLGLGVSLGQLVEGLQATAGLVLEVHEDRELAIPGEGFAFPHTEFLFRIDGLSALADAIVERAASDPLLRSTQTPDWIIVSPAIRLPPPWNAYEPSFAKEVATGRIYAASSPAFLKRCVGTVESVTTTAEFVRAFAQLPSEGNGLAYLTPTMTRAMHGLLDQIAGVNGSSIPVKLARFFLPDAGSPVAWVAESKPNGLLFASHTSSSHKSTLLTFGAAALLPGIAVVGASWLGGGAEQEEPPFVPPF